MDLIKPYSPFVSEEPMQVTLARASEDSRGGPIVFGSFRIRINNLTCTTRVSSHCPRFLKAQSEFANNSINCGPLTKRVA